MASLGFSLVWYADYLGDFLGLVALDVEKGVNGVDLAYIMDLHYVLEVVLQFFLPVALRFEVYSFRKGDHFIGDLYVIHPSLKFLTIGPILHDEALKIGWNVCWWCWFLHRAGRVWTSSRSLGRFLWGICWFSPWLSLVIRKSYARRCRKRAVSSLCQDNRLEVTWVAGLRLSYNRCKAILGIFIVMTVVGWSLDLSSNGTGVS